MSWLVRFTDMLMVDSSHQEAGITMFTFMVISHFFWMVAEKLEHGAAVTPSGLLAVHGSYVFSSGLPDAPPFPGGTIGT